MHPSKVGPIPKQPESRRKTTCFSSQKRKYKLTTYKMRLPNLFLDCVLRRANATIPNPQTKAVRATMEEDRREW